MMTCVWSYRVRAAIPPKSAEIRRDNKGDLGATGRLKTTDTGGSWTYRTDKALRHEIFGKVKGSVSDQTATRKYVTGIGITL